MRVAVPAVFDMDEAVNTFDFAIPVGLSYEFYNFVIDARYTFGVTKVFDQDVIDRAVKLLRRDIALFKGLSDGVELLNSDVASIQLYDLNGRPVTSSRRHRTRDTYIMKVTAGDKNVTRKITVR